MSWLSWLTGKLGSRPQTEAEQHSYGLNEPQPARSLEYTTYSREELLAEGSKLIDGWNLIATMSRRTPLEWLLRHGEWAETPTDLPMEFAWWTPRLKSLKELGIRGNELPPSTMASEIGQIPDDGGDFLPFLIEYRKIVEGQSDRPAILSALDRLGEAHPTILEKLGGSLSRSFVLSELQTLPGCGPKTAERLFDAGFRSAAEVQTATLDQLMLVQGIGQKTAGLLTRAG